MCIKISRIRFRALKYKQLLHVSVEVYGVKGKYWMHVKVEDGQEAHVHTPNHTRTGRTINGNDKGQGRQGLDHNKGQTQPQLLLYLGSVR